MLLNIVKATDGEKNGKEKQQQQRKPTLASLRLDKMMKQKHKATARSEQTKTLEEQVMNKSIKRMNTKENTLNKQNTLALSNRTMKREKMCPRAGAQEMERLLGALCRRHGEVGL